MTEQPTDSTGPDEPVLSVTIHANGHVDINVTGDLPVDLAVDWLLRLAEAFESGQFETVDPE